MDAMRIATTTCLINMAVSEHWGTEALVLALSSGSHCTVQPAGRVSCECCCGLNAGLQPKAPTLQMLNAGRGLSRRTGPYDGPVLLFVSNESPTKRQSFALRLPMGRCETAWSHCLGCRGLPVSSLICGRVAPFSTPSA